MRLIYFGSGSFGLPTIQCLHERHELVTVVTSPDQRAGRKQHFRPTPIADWGLRANVHVRKSENVNTSEFIDGLRVLRPDAAVVIAFGQKLSNSLVNVLGPLAINLHGSLLPKYRGAAPIQWAMIRGESDTGLSVISIAPELDSGLIYAQMAAAIDPLETAGELHDRLGLLGPELALGVLADLESGTLRGENQDVSAVTRAPKLKKTDSAIDFTADADVVRCRIHGLTPWPGARVRWNCGATGSEQDLLLRRAKVEVDMTCSAAPGTVLADQCVATGRAAIRLLEVQVPGRRAMPIEEFIRGHRLQPGDVLC